LKEEKKKEKEKEHQQKLNKDKEDINNKKGSSFVPFIEFLIIILLLGALFFIYLKLGRDKF